MFSESSNYSCFNYLSTSEQKTKALNPVYFIAEVGKACNGDLSYCKRILQECKKNGANAVRFHHFFLKENVHRDVLQKPTERAWSFKLHLPFIEEKLFEKEEYKNILSWCNELGLDFIAAPWDLKALEMFQGLGITKYKVSSLNFMNIPLVMAILRIAEKSYISTGGISEEEVDQFCKRLHLSQYDVALLHSVVAYPAPANIVNMRAIELLRQYHPQVGYSSNDLTKTAILMACALGASVIEKHVHLPEKTSELHRASVEVSQFAEEIANVREMKELLKRKIKQETRGEMVNQELLSKGLVAKEDLPAGTVLNEFIISPQLPPRGINVKSWFQVMGKRLVSPCKKGDFIYSAQVDGFKDKKTVSQTRSSFPGKRGVVVRLKDLDELIEGRTIDYVEVHYAGSDLKKPDECKDYDLDLVVHLPEYSEGRLLDLCSRDPVLRRFSVDVISKVMERARKLKAHFKKCKGPLKFIVHPGGLTYPTHDRDPLELNELFLSSMKQMDTDGLEVLAENMNPFAWFLDGDWTPKQGVSNNFLDPVEIAVFCKNHGYNICLDLCHAQLFCNNTGTDLYSYMNTVKPFVKHLHFSDCYGVDGEGLQIGYGECPWQHVCEVFEDFKYGWTPEIWNGHQDHGEKFYEAHELLTGEFEKYFQTKTSMAGCTKN